jgi:hypothetical protein
MSKTVFVESYKAVEELLKTGKKMVSEWNSELDAAEQFDQEGNGFPLELFMKIYSAQEGFNINTPAHMLNWRMSADMFEDIRGKTRIEFEKRRKDAEEAAQHEAAE